jgi:hypothetical protein
MSAQRNARLVASGVVLIISALVLELGNRRPDAEVFLLAFGIGACAASGVVALAARARATIYVVLMGAYVAYGVTASLVGTASTHRSLFLFATTVALGLCFTLLHEHANGIPNLVAILRTNEAGYALVVDEDTAARTVEGELARSRRHDRPLSFLLLEPDGRARAPEFENELRHVSSLAVRELEEVYTRARICELIAEQVRRSDVVVSSAKNQFVVISTDTSEAGTAALAARMSAATEAALGVSLRSGIATFPAQGTNYGELVATAAEAVGRSEREVPAEVDGAATVTNVAPVAPLAAAPDGVPATWDRAQANP